MKKSVKMILLLLLLAVISVAIILIPKDDKNDNSNDTEIIGTDDPLGVNGSDNSDDELEGDLIFYCNPSTMKWTTANGEVFDFKKKDYYWVKSDDETFSIEDSYLEEMINQISNIYSTRTIENVANMDEYGFNNPALTIIIDGDKTLMIGDQSSVSTDRYLSIGDGNVYLIKPDLLNAFNVNMEDIYYPIDESGNSIEDLSGEESEVEFVDE